jgi:hypothetical protein
MTTVFNNLLGEVFCERLADFLPARVLPISTEPVPPTIEQIIDSEYVKIQTLLAPGRRSRDEARGRIRTLLAMESHSAEDVVVSEKGISRIERAIKGRRAFSEIFPRLSGIETIFEGEGAHLTVHFAKTKGVPVTFIAADDPRDAAALREVDLQKKYYIGATDLAE